MILLFADRPRRTAQLVIAGVCVLAAGAAHGYVGPGAGIAFATTLFVLLTTVVVVVFGLLFWPLRALYRWARRKRPPEPARIDRAVIVGLDGLDPDLTRRFMDEGHLPNLSRLAQSGGFSPLGTTFPAMSPVAWSSFATGVHPPKHGIFDFLDRDRATYLPRLSSARIGAPRRTLKVAGHHIPLSGPIVRLLRKSVPFWKTLGAHGVPCSILRVPLTFPAEQFEGGTMLSAMCVPDLKGTQGSFTLYSTAAGPDIVNEGDVGVGGERVTIRFEDGVAETALEGPPSPVRPDRGPMRIPLRLRREPGALVLEIEGERHRLEPGRFSAWVPVAFRMGLGLRARGICRFRLMQLEPQVVLYVTPINIDPSRPSLPISHPRVFSVFLSRLVGRFATLGLAEDTWALNEGALDEAAFLEQAWANHAERESMFFEMLARMPKGVTACVFDGTDRIQHMFMRFLDDGHPARPDDETTRRWQHVVRDTYARMDEMVGRVMESVPLDDPRTLLVVMSDHGFKTFRRGVNLNSWLHRYGYLALKPGADGSGEWFADVDWSRTRAFALGLGGVFLNVRGREGQGVVPPEAADALAQEIADALTGLVDPALDAVAIRQAYTAADLYQGKGPYAEDAPDIIVGYAAGWRASWRGVRGIVDDAVFVDNDKAWSGDHCIDPALVPGVLIANRRLARPDGAQPAIVDLAPTLLQLFGVPPARHIDGVVLD